MSMRTRAVFLVIVIVLLLRPFLANGNPPIRFEQGAIIIPTTLYGGFLIDRDGFLWVGTTGLGALRYDGNELKSFAEFLQGSIIGAIVEDTDGVIWIASFSKGITAYDKETGEFTGYKHIPGNTNSLASNNISFSPQKLFVEKSNKLWVGTDDAGLSEYNKATDTWTHYKHNPDDTNSLSDNAVLAICEGKDGALWIGTQKGGLNRFHRETGTWTHYRHDPDDPNSLNDNWINAILEDNDGVLWIGTKKAGLDRFDRERGVFIHYSHDPKNPRSISSNEVWSLCEGHSGTIWVCHMASSTSGLDLLHKKSGFFTRYGHNPNDPTSISSNSITRVYEDRRTETLWIVNSTGHIDKQAKNTIHFRHWPGAPKIPNSLSDRSILPIIEDRNNIVWVGTMSGGLNRIDRETGKITHYLPGSDDPLSIPRSRITALLEDSSGILWLGLWDGILASFDRETGKCIRIYEHDPGDPHSITESERLKYILEDRDNPNILWLATIKGGLNKFDKSRGAFTHYKHLPGNPNSLSHNSMPTLYDDGKGVLWIPTYGGGLDRFDKRKETFTNYRHEAGNPNSLGSNTLYEILETSDGGLWISRKGGISQFDPKSGHFKNFDKDEDGVPYGPVGSLLEDDKGNLWLGTVGGGLVRFDPKTGATKRFTVDDGLQSNTFYWTSRLKTKNGEMWFGGSNGITRFFPSQITQNPHVPPIVLTAFTQGGEPVSTGSSPERLKEIILNWRNNYFEFRFSALNFETPKKNRYAYMLEGWDEDWYHSGSNPFGRYTGLAGGKYTLKLKGSNNDGVWNNDGASVTVIVTPPFWKTGWFIAVIAAVGLTILLFVVFYMRKLQTEISERKQVEEELRESEKKFRVLYDNSPDMYVSVSLENASILLCNETLLNKTSYSREEIIGSPIFKMYHDDCIVEAKKAFRQFVETGAIRDKELILKRKDGSKIHVSLNVNSVKDETGQTLYSIFSWRDITEAKLAEEALRESEDKFRSFAEQSIVGIYLISDDVFKYVNPKFAEIFGYCADECLDNMHFPQLVHPEDLATVEKQVDRRLSGETKTVRYSFRGIKKNGETIHVEIFGASMFLKGKTVATGTILDITDRKQAEEKRKQLQAQLQQAQKMEAMGTLAGGIAHDFNNLLMAIQGRTSIMLMKKDSSHRDIKHLKGIEDNVESAADLTRQLLGFARGGKYEVKPTDLNELIEKENRMFGRTRKEVTIHGKYAEDLWPVEVDQGQIEQVLLNLYVNAWQAMPAGGDLYLETENVTLDENYVKPFPIEPGKYVKISVTDTGAGMDRAIQEKIFDPFFTTKEMGRGTGLGLASAYGIIKNHGGFINVYSEKGHGSTFNIYLPASEKEAMEEKKPTGDTLRGTETVLFVDDEDMIIEIAEELFDQLGYKVLTARTGKEAIEIYEKNKEQIDIVLLDMIMPDMSGSDTYDSLKEIDPDIKVLLSSGYSVEGRATEILNRGCGGFIQKPFKMKELSQKLREILDEK